MRIKVLSDSTCDLPLELISQNDITLVPLNVIKNGENFLDGITIDPQDIFDHVAAGGDLCSTAAVSVGDYQDYFAKYTGEYDAVVHINIGSGFSASHQNALLAAEDYANVLVVDSRLLTTGQGLVVLETCRLVKEGKDLEQIRKELECFIPRVEVSFILERLDYMVKGGRCSTAAALGANLLNLKPCIEIVDGKLTVVKKYRGSFSKCVDSYTKDRLADPDRVEHAMLAFPHTLLADGDLAAAMTAAEKYGPFENVLDAKAGCTVSCHCGPGTLGIVCLRK